MAVDKLIDSAQLDSALTATASAIRARTGSSTAIPWNLSTGFQSAIDDIPSGGASDTEDMVITSPLSIIGLELYHAKPVISVHFPQVTSIGQSAFAECSLLTTVNFPAAVTIGSSAFSYCSNLTSISFPVAEVISARAFQNCHTLQSVSFPAVTEIRPAAFQSCYQLTDTSFPHTQSILAIAFSNCSSLTTISFPALSYLSSCIFWNCYRLVSLYLLGSFLCQLGNSNNFYSTPIEGYSDVAGQYGSIYVPASLLTDYQTSTNWVYFYSRFVGLTDEEIAALEG